jgi:putative endonuclease
MFFYYVYILRSTSNRRYVGYTTDLKRRLEEHNTGQNISTKPYRPWTLVFYEAFPNEQDARRREAYFKTTQGRRALTVMLREYYKGDG